MKKNDAATLPPESRLELSEAEIDRIAAAVMRKQNTKDLFEAARFLVSKGFHVIPGRLVKMYPETYRQAPPFSSDPDPRELRNPFDQALNDLAAQEYCYQNCYGDWLADGPPPPSTIPEHLLEPFTLGGRVPLRYQYLDNRPRGQLIISAATYERAFRQIEAGRFRYYGDEVEAFYDALPRYPLAGQEVIVWGLAGCNCEALAVWQKARKVYVVDYNKPICEHEKIQVLSHEEAKSQRLRPGFAISYSSFEHDGLGRYGDPLDPEGDFKAMRDAHELLADEGLMFLGVPLGPDLLKWNGCRVYGRIRLPLLLRFWALEDVFQATGGSSPDYPFDQPLGIAFQPLLILRKISDEFPEDSWFEEKLAAADEEAKQNPGGLRDSRLLARLLRMVWAGKERLKKNPF